MIKSEIMYCAVKIVILLSLTPFNRAVTFLPSIFWDTNNPILQRQYWNEVTKVKIHDRLTFVCPNEIIKIRGRDVKQGVYANGLYHNLYVKEIPEDATNFEEACDTSENSTAIFITNCDKPKEFYYKNIPINVNQAHPDLPKFKYGKNYMFFATSDGSMESIQPRNTTSKNCTMVFRIYFNTREEERPIYSCPLFDRKNVCQEEKPSEQKGSWEKEMSQNESKQSLPACKSGTPVKLNTTKTTDNNVIVSWQLPGNNECRYNITYYTVCYRENSTALCKEELVSGKKHSATLFKLSTGQKYYIKVRAHTSKGPGNYSKEITFETAKKNDPEISALQDKESASIHGTSVAIGFVIGFFLATVIAAAIWIFVTRIYNKKQKVFAEKNEEENEDKNNPNFYKGEDELNGVIELNTGYRESGQNWKLPAVEEENLHLYCSDA